ncbi:hypothetical protein LC55x_3327 [Lysobacter capsici]|uniref:Uncharacterized protein n=1 Tax=Lysobacter capsici AZ78 TaxID=1444315 RepID=A0A108U4B7_9GAMM|nr:hypothetical protein LC55x_3327 [Lysobacter capsici]KWS02309.1 hypothetical protein AZ78_4976 [Lysobacter capsici AZ78]
MNARRETRRTTRIAPRHRVALTPPPMRLPHTIGPTSTPCATRAQALDGHHEQDS